MAFTANTRNRSALVLLIILQTVVSTPYMIVGTAQSASAPAAEQSIVLTVTVNDQKGRVVTGLRSDNFEVLVDKAPAKVSSANLEDAPLSVGLLVDASASSVGTAGSQTRRDAIQYLRQHVRNFLDESNPQNEYFLMGFNIKPQILVDWTSDVASLVDALSLAESGESTAYYDACYLAIEKVQKGRHSKRVLIVLSDGQDNNSRYKKSQVREALKESNVLFYSIDYDSRSDAFIAEHILSDLSSTSGGSVFYGRMFDPRETFTPLEALADILRYQYTVVIQPANAAGKDRRWHKIKLKVRPPAESRLAVSAKVRQGFYMN